MQLSGHGGNCLCVCGVFGKIVVFMRVGAFVVKLGANDFILHVRPFGVAPAVRAQRAAHELLFAGAQILAEGGGLPFLLRIGEQGGEASALEIRRRLEPAEFSQRGIDVHKLDERLCTLAGLLPGCADNQRRVRTQLKIRHLGEDAVFAEMITMVTEQYDDGVLAQAKPVQFIKHAADLCIDKARAGAIAANEIERHLVRDAARRRHITVGAKFIPVVQRRGGHIGRGLIVVRQLDRVCGIEIPILLRAGKRQMRLVKTNTEEERLLHAFEALEGLDGFCRCLAVAVNIVRFIRGLKGWAAHEFGAFVGRKFLDGLQLLIRLLGEPALIRHAVIPCGLAP